MAGDWIPMRIELADDPAVISVAAATGIDEFGVVGRLHRLWGWANRHLTDGNARSVTENWVDRFVSCPRFARALAEAGWLRIRDQSVEFPKFEKWNSQGAKKRALTAKRAANHREKVTQESRSRNANSNAPSVTDALPKEEKRRVNTTPQTPREGGEKVSTKAPGSDLWFAEFWNAYPRKENRAKAHQAWTKLNPDRGLVDAILRAIAAQKVKGCLEPRSDPSGRSFIPHPTSWINGRRWEDQPPEEVKPKSAVPDFDPDQYIQDRINDARAQQS